MYGTLDECGFTAILTSGANLERASLVRGLFSGLCLLMGIFLPAVAHAGAWTVRKGEIYLELFNQFSWTDEDFNASGRRVDKPNRGRFDEFRSEAKIEAGIWREGFNLLFSLPVETAYYKDRNVSLRTTDVEEIRLGAKYRFTDTPPLTPGGVLISGQVMGKFPACDLRDEPPLADCQIDYEGLLILSRGFWERNNISRLFMSLEGGYRFRTEKPADEIPYVLEGGYNFRWNLWVKGRLEGVESRPWGGGAEEDFTKWSASLLLSEDPSQRNESDTFTLEIGYGEVFAGRNTGALQQGFLKLAYQGAPSGLVKRAKNLFLR